MVEIMICILINLYVVKPATCISLQDFAKDLGNNRDLKQYGNH